MLSRGNGDEDDTPAEYPARFGANWGNDIGGPDDSGDRPAWRPPAEDHRLMPTVAGGLSQRRRILMSSMQVALPATSRYG
ncbi:hypothetical protein SAMN04489729_4313 [Amycolatopsis lurida]|nr:hypothetical protein SAMN04489729_4313 [Amycolatopsis lurida]